MRFIIYANYDEIVTPLKKVYEKNAGCEDRTHDLGIMRPTLFQLSQTRPNSAIPLFSSNKQTTYDYFLAFAFAFNSFFNAFKSLGISVAFS